MDSHNARPGRVDLSPGRRTSRFLFPGGHWARRARRVCRRRQPADTPSVVVVRRAEQIWGGRFVVDEELSGRACGPVRRDAMTPDVAGAPDETTTGGAGVWSPCPSEMRTEPSGYVEVNQRATAEAGQLSAQRGAPCLWRPLGPCLWLPLQASG